MSDDIKPPGLQALETSHVSPTSPPTKGMVFDVNITLTTQEPRTAMEVQEALVRAFNTRAFGLKASYTIKPFEPVDE